MSPGPTLPVTSKPSSTKMRDTTHLRLLAGETEVIRASNSDGCPWAKFEDNMVATNARVLFLWRQWFFGMCIASQEEAFYVEDLQFLSLVRFMSWMWLLCGLLGIIVAAIILAIADASKPTYDSGPYSSYASSMSSAMSGTYATLVAIGVILLLAGIVCVVVFIVKHLSRCVYVSLNFSRKNVGIVDWSMLSWWKPRMSSTRRMIKLPKATAQEAYNALQQQLHNKFSVKVNLRDPRARESAEEMM